MEEYKCGKARLPSILENYEDPVMKTVQPAIKTGREWKAVKSYRSSQRILKIKEVMGQTQTDRKGLGSPVTKWWSKSDGKEKKMVINEIRLNEDSRRVKHLQQGQWTNCDSALQKSLTWNDMWHVMPLQISFLIRSVNNLLHLNASPVQWGKKEDPTCPLCNGR